MEGLPTELKALIISMCDFPTHITLLCVNSHFNSLVHPYTSSLSTRHQFLLSYESSTHNRIFKLPSDARQTVQWHEQHQALWRSKKLYTCFLCNKLRLPEKFARGQCWRMMLAENYSDEQKRFCIDCGMSRVPRKYVPGAMIMGFESGGNVHLCGWCGEWSTDFYCMREKKCFSCTEGVLEEPERFVEGFENDDIHGKNEAELDFRDFENSNTSEKDEEKKRPLGAEMSADQNEDETRNWPRRPPCCRSCGGHWRYTSWHFGRYDFDGDGSYKLGYVISGTAKSEMSPIPDSYMKNFCPFPY